MHLATGIACLIAAACSIGFIAIWFSTVYRELSDKRRCLYGLLEQLQLHKSASAQARDGPSHAVASRMLTLNQSIFRDATDNYNRLLKKPMNRLPALLMGFHPADSSRLQEDIEQRGEQTALKTHGERGEK